jgi:hypothetical protein
LRQWDPRQNLSDVIVGITENTLGAGYRFAQPGTPPQSRHLIEISISWDCADRGPASEQNHSDHQGTAFLSVEPAYAISQVRADQCDDGVAAFVAPERSVAAAKSGHERQEGPSLSG